MRVQRGSESRKADQRLWPPFSWPSWPLRSRCCRARRPCLSVCRGCRRAERDGAVSVVAVGKTPLAGEKERVKCGDQAVFEFLKGN